MPLGDVTCSICGQWGHNCPGIKSNDPFNIISKPEIFQYKLLNASINFILSQNFETTDDLRDAIRKVLNDHRKGY